LLDEVAMSLGEISAGSNSKGILFTGPSGTGKTTALDMVVSDFLPYVEGVQRRVPCCRVAAKAESNMKSVARSILDQLGKPLATTSRLSRDELETQVHAALDACGVQVLILEELNNALLVGSSALRGQLAQFLKNLWNQHPAGDPSLWSQPQMGRNDKRLAIIVSGTADLRPVFDRDRELASRFRCRVNMQPLWFDSNRSLRCFRDLFDSLASRFELHGAIDTGDSEVLARSLFACKAHLRDLETLLTRASSLSRSEKGSITGCELLGDAFDRVLRSDSSQENPFRWSREDLRARILVAQKSKAPV